NVSNRGKALAYRCTQPASVLDCYGNALVCHACEHRIRYSHAHLAFTGTALFAAAVDQPSNLADRRGLHLLDRTRQFRNPGLDFGIRFDGGVQYARISSGLCDVAILIEDESEVSQMLRI